MSLLARISVRRASNVVLYVRVLWVRSQDMNSLIIVLVRSAVMT